MPQQYKSSQTLPTKSSVENNVRWWTADDSDNTGNFMPFYKINATMDSSVEDKKPSLADYYLDDMVDPMPYYVTTMTLDAAFAVIGTLINGWFLAAILKSPEIRSGMRNKILCAILAVNLTESMITFPFTAIRELMGYFNVRLFWNCLNYIVPTTMYHIQDFMSNWYIFILVCVYAAQVMNFEPRFSPLWMKIVTAVVITSPCVLALLFVPLTINTFLHPSRGFCSEITFKGHKVYASVDTIVPQSLASLLLLVTAVLKYRLHTDVRLCAQHIDDRSHIDRLCPFVALLVNAVVTDLFLAISLMNLQLLLRLGSKIWAPMAFVFKLLCYLRLILVPVLLLLFPDIRERIKTWRPCRRSAHSPVDLVVTYEKNAS